MAVSPAHSVVLLLISFMLWLPSYAGVFTELLKYFFVPLAVFCLLSAGLAKVFAKTDFSGALQNSLFAYSAFLLVTTVGLTLVGFLSSTFLFSIWWLPLLILVLLIFSSWSLFAFFYLTGFNEVNPTAGFARRLVIFALSAVGLVLAFYLLGMTPGHFSLNPMISYG